MLLLLWCTLHSEPFCLQRHIRQVYAIGSEHNICIVLSVHLHREPHKHCSPSQSKAIGSCSVQRTLYPDFCNTGGQPECMSFRSQQLHAMHAGPVVAYCLCVPTIFNLIHTSSSGQAADVVFGSASGPHDYLHEVIHDCDRCYYDALALQKGN